MARSILTKSLGADVVFTTDIVVPAAHVIIVMDQTVPRLQLRTLLRELLFRLDADAAPYGANDLGLT